MTPIRHKLALFALLGALLWAPPSPAILVEFDQSLSVDVSTCIETLGADVYLLADDTLISQVAMITKVIEQNFQRQSVFLSKHAEEERLAIGRELSSTEVFLKSLVYLLELTKRRKINTQITFHERYGWVLELTGEPGQSGYNRLTRWLNKSFETRTFYSPIYMALNHGVLGSFSFPQNQVMFEWKVLLGESVAKHIFIHEARHAYEDFYNQRNGGAGFVISYIPADGTRFFDGNYGEGFWSSELITMIGDALAASRNPFLKAIMKEPIRSIHQMSRIMGMYGEIEKFEINKIEPTDNGHAKVYLIAADPHVERHHFVFKWKHDLDTTDLEVLRDYLSKDNRLKKFNLDVAAHAALVFKRSDTIIDRWNSLSPAEFNSEFHELRKLILKIRDMRI